MLQGKKIVIGITGSIAAYKIPALVRLLIKEGAEVRVVMSPAACDFVTPLTLSTLTGHPVRIEPFNAADGSWNSHVEIGGWADALVMAPLTANTMAKMAHGITDNLLMAVYLAAKCPVFFAPAMDLDMFRHPTTQANMDRLASFGHILIEPATGELASGLIGAGRMEEPEQILGVLKKYFAPAKNKLSGKKVLVTAGPTWESIDPVRFIGNFSSGRMGFCIADEFARRGATVFLVTGPTTLESTRPGIRRFDVTTAAEMLQVVERLAPKVRIVIMAAAVADYRPKQPALEKIKKKGGELLLELVKTTDILAALGQKKKTDQVLVGFALESGRGLESARRKMMAKNLDMIVLNSLKDKGAGFGTLTNKVTIITRNAKPENLPLKSKEEVAVDIADRTAALI